MYKITDTNLIIKNIAENIPSDYRNPGLFVGNSGAALLYGNMFLHGQREEYEKITYQYFQNALDQIKSSDTSLASGITGVAYAMDWLARQGFNSDSNGIIVELDKIIVRSIEEDIDVQNFDYLYGYLGKGHYFLQKSPQSKYVDLVHQTLLDTVSNSVKTPFWKDILLEQEEDITTFSFGSAHGLASIIYFLCKSIHYSGDPTRSKNIIFNALNALKEFELKNSISLYPDNHSSKNSTRLGWCRGDFGIAMSFKLAGQTLQYPAFIKESKRIYSFCANRNLIDSFIRADEQYIESGFCHGLAGNAYIFYDAYKQTRIFKYYEAFEFWRNHLINTYEKNKAFFQYSPEDKKWLKNHNLLQGDVGIALMLLEIENQDLDLIRNLFLIS